MAETFQSPRAFHVMLKPRGPICNLDCQYCFYLKKDALYPHSAFRMSAETLEEFIRSYIQAQRVPEVTFAWQGGEPTLMGIDFYRRAIELQEKYRRPGMQIFNSFQTNATLLSDEWASFFAQNHFLIGVSLDGPGELHNAYRVDKGGKPTFDRVLAGIDYLKKWEVDTNILACVNNLTARQPLAVYRFLRDSVGTDFIQFIPIVEKDPNHPEGVSSRSVSARDYGYFLITIFDEWVRKDVSRVFVQIFDAALAAWSGNHPGLCIFEETCGAALAMEHNGDVYACDHFVDPPHYLGNLAEQPLSQLAGSPAQLAFGLDKKTSLPKTCKACPVRFACNGGCPKDRFIQTSEGETGLNYLCPGYLAFFSHVDQPMRQMSEMLRQHRPPAEIMTLIPPQSRKRH
jgi:uncharacterized protein